MLVRILFDECVPRQLRKELIGFEVRTAPELGWSGVKNGALIALAAERGFDAIFTVDRGFAGSPPLLFPIAILILETGTTDPTLLVPWMAAVSVALAEMRPGEIRRMGGSGEAAP